MFKFSKSDSAGEVVCQYHIEDCTWPEVVEKFQEFLSGCGFYFKSGFSMGEILEEAHRERLEELRAAREQEVNQQLPLDLGNFI